MELTREAVEAKAGEYRETEPLYAVEREHVEMLPETLRSGDFGWRDAEWVVQWYYRRGLGSYPDRERREREDRFRDNAFEDVLDAIGVAAADTDADTATRLDRLTDLDGVDVPVGSAFLLYAFPERYVAIGGREWDVLRRSGAVETGYPDPVTVEDYLTYETVTRELLDRFDVTAWTLYRALWRLGAPDGNGDGDGGRDEDGH